MNTQRLYEIFAASRGVTTDTRRCEAGTMFFALKGASFNGNEFAGKALDAGCVCAVIDEPQYAVDERCIVVDDVLTALQQLAAMHRQRMGGQGLRVLQITGTNGKTTTKELCAAVLSRKYNVLYTEGNLNNHIGVPLTLLRLTREHEVAVIETGANHPGEIATLTDIVRPDCGLITNVGRAHLEGFGGFEGVKRTKGELYDWLSANNRLAFVNRRDRDLDAMAAARTAQHGMTCIDYAEGEPTMADGMLVALINHDNAVCKVPTHLVGAYNLPNVLAAVTVGRYFGVPEADIHAAISQYQPTNNRSQMVKTGRNTLIVDAYNANPSSMALAISNFAAVDGQYKVMMLGDMRELGAESETEHRAVYEQALAICADELWLVGSEFAKVAKAGRYNLDQHIIHVRLFADVEGVKETLSDKSLHDCTILIKGSNGTRLYQLPPLL